VQERDDRIVIRIAVGETLKACEVFECPKQS
jgi:hypothetical protein